MKLDSICGHFRGRINILDLIDKPMRDIHSLYVLAFNKSTAEQERAEEDAKNGKKQGISMDSVEELVDLMEEGG